MSRQGIKSSRRDGRKYDRAKPSRRQLSPDWPSHAPLRPMEAKLVAELPSDSGWQFEPKWDGFRCIAFRDHDRVELRSKSGTSLGRYFPEVVAMLARTRPQRFVVDGELAISIDNTLSFDALQLRLHPAASRIEKLSDETPATFILFDCLATAKDGCLVQAPLVARRNALEKLYQKLKQPRLRLSPYVRDVKVAGRWLALAGGDLDGVIAKRLDGAYEGGERAMLKVKRLRSADCVVGGFRYLDGRKEVGSLLLGLYDAKGKLNHVGFTSGIAADVRPGLTKRLEKLVAPPGFTGKTPGAPSRWSTDRSAAWCPLKPKLVAEVRYDHITGDRFRHGTAFLRWRPDKAPRQCRLDQLEAEAGPDVLTGKILKA